MSLADLAGQSLPALAAVIGLLVFAAWGMKRSGLAERLGGTSGDRLKLLATRAIDPRHRLVLVACDGREHLLAIGPSGISILEQGRDVGRDPGVAEEIKP